MDLVNLLTSQLGVSDNQAKGGAGLLFKMAKDQLGGSDFSKVADAVPGMGDLLKAAPEPEGAMSAVGGLLSKFGGSGAAKLGGLASVASGFSQLNLDKDMVGKFVPQILSFVQKSGGDSIKGLLAGIFK